MRSSAAACRNAEDKLDARSSLVAAAFAAALTTGVETAKETAIAAAEAAEDGAVTSRADTSREETDLTDRCGRLGGICTSSRNSWRERNRGMVAVIA